ncbi:MAG TPA: transglutaminase-like domain-containing protein [Gemmatales bacterium]|nr:transglutaminase-like domain-containing protein [Gemmatales bacterium]
MGKNQDLVVRGRPDGNSIELEVLDQSGKKVVYRQKKPWDSRARGILFQDRYLEGIKDWTTGKTYTVYGFVQTLNAVAPGTFTVLGKKKMTLHGEERELEELEQSYPRECYLEKSRHYVDPETGVSWMTTEDSSLFDVISHIRCNKAQALAPFAGTVRDHDVPVTMDKPIPMTLLELPSKLKLALEMSEEEHPEQVFLNTPRQQFLQKQGKRSEFRLTAKPKSYPPEPMPGPEYLESNFYIRSEDAHVKKLAMEIVGEAKTTEAKMKRIHRWVGKNVKGGYEVGFATADEVARTLEGDCTEMGVLAAALGRVAGIPSRVCFGLVYDPTHAGFGGHLWIEAYVDNCWKTYDPTGVLDVLGAAYLRIDGYSMANVLIPDELPGVRRGFAGRMKVYLLEHR